MRSNQQASLVTNIALDDYREEGFHQLLAAKDVDNIDMLINKYYFYLAENYHGLLGEAVYELAVLDVNLFEKWASENWLPFSMAFDTWSAALAI